jgi:hypothetical protein
MWVFVSELEAERLDHQSCNWAVRDMISGKNKELSCLDVG